MGVRTCGKYSRLAVGLAAVFYGGDANGVSVVMEAHAVVAGPQPELRWFDVLETFDVAFAGFQITGQRVEDAQGGRLVDGAKLSLRLVVPDNVFAHAQRSALRGSSGVRPMRSKSSMVRLNSARTLS